MRTVHTLLFLLAALLAASSAHAARTAPIVNYEDVLVASGNGKPLSAEQVRKAVITGASRSRWAASAQPGNTVRVTYNRGGHIAVADVVYSAKSYSIRYVDSTNLNYAQEAGKPVIHPNYNKWIGSLKQGIETALRSSSL